MSNKEKYDNIFTSIFRVEAAELNSDFAYRKVVTWDSIVHMSLLSTIEDEFGIMFDTTDILDFKSYEAGKEILAKYNVTI